MSACNDDPRPPFASGSDTSRDAADSVWMNTATLRERILAWIEAQGERGATTDEAEVHFRLPHQTVSARFWELAGRNMRRQAELPARILETSERRQTRSGRAAAVYVTLAAGVPQPIDGRQRMLF